jgi:hypothetical protein
VDRAKLDWERGDLYGNWLALRPLLNAWIARAIDQEWQSKLLNELRLYEEQRLAFVHRGALTGSFVSGRNWGAFQYDANVPEILTRLVDDQPLTPNLVAKSVLVLVRRQSDQLSAYCVDQNRVDDLVKGAADLLRAFE